MARFEMSQGVILTGEHAAACVVDTLKSVDIGHHGLRPTIPRGILYALSACRASPSCCIQLIETIFAHGVFIRTLKDLAEHWIVTNHAIAGVCGSFGQRIHGNGVSFTGCVLVRGSSYGFAGWPGVCALPPLVVIFGIVVM